MKKNWILIAIATMTFFACSTDNEGNNDELETSALVGTWNMTDVRFDEDLNDTTLNLAEELVDQFVQENCVLVSFTFNADGTASSTDKLNFIVFNAGPMGLDVSCPTESESETGTWTLEGDQLTVDNGSGTTETLTIGLEGNTLIIAGEDIDANNYAGAEVVFTRA